MSTASRVTCPNSSIHASRFLSRHIILRNNFHRSIARVILTTIVRPRHLFGRPSFLAKLQNSGKIRSPENIHRHNNIIYVPTITIINKDNSTSPTLEMFESFVEDDYVLKDGSLFVIISLSSTLHLFLRWVLSFPRTFTFHTGCR